MPPCASVGLDMPRWWPTFWPRRRRESRGLRGHEPPGESSSRTTRNSAHRAVRSPQHARPCPSNGLPVSRSQNHDCPEHHLDRRSDDVKHHSRREQGCHPCVVPGGAWPNPPAHGDDAYKLTSLVELKSVRAWAKPCYHFVLSGRLADDDSDRLPLLKMHFVAYHELRILTGLQLPALATTKPVNIGHSHHKSHDVCVRDCFLRNTDPRHAHEGPFCKRFPCGGGHAARCDQARENAHDCSNPNPEHGITSCESATRPDWLDTCAANRTIPCSHLRRCRVSLRSPLSPATPQ